MYVRKQKNSKTILVRLDYGERVDMNTFFKSLELTLPNYEREGWSLEFSNEDVKEYCFEEYIGAPCGGQK